MAKTNLLAMALERPRRERTPVRDDLVRSLMEQQAHAGAGTPVYSIGQGLARSGNMMLLSLMDKWEKDEKSDERKKLADKLFGTTGGGTSESGGKLAKVLKGEKIAPSVGVEDTSRSRGIRNNNPGNIEFGPFAERHGAVGSDGRFAQFEDPKQGVGAMQALLGSYQDRGLNTIEQMVNRWAPPSENDSGAYAQAVASAVGVDPRQPIDINDPAISGPVIQAMIEHENGQMPYGSEVFGGDAGPRVQPAGMNTSGVEPQTVPDPQAINLRREFEPHVGGVGNAYIDMQRQQAQTGQLPDMRGMAQQAQAAPPAPDAARIAPDMPQQPFAAPEAQQGATDPMQEQVGLLSAIPMEEQVVLRQMVESGEIQPFQVLQYARELRAEQQPEYGYETMPDGTLLQINKRDGSVQPIYEGGPKPEKANLATLELPDGTKRTFDLGTPDGRGAAQEAISQGAVEVRTPATQVNIGGDMSPGRKKIDELFAETYESWVTGGFADVFAQVDQLDGVARQLESGAPITGPMIGAAEKTMPESLFAYTYPDALAARDAVTEVAQRSLREILGAQFTEKEGERLIARTYNMNASPQENAVRVRRLLEKVKAMAEAKQKAVDYFNQNGSLEGYDGRIPSLRDLYADEEGAAPAAGGETSTGIPWRVID